MARKSRSKQRGKGVGSRSQGAGQSKGGSRSSAGSAGGSKSGGNRSGSGARGNKGRSTSSKSTSSKGKSTTSSKSTSKATKSPSRKTYRRPATTVAQQRFRDREAAGLSGLTGGPKGESISQYRARQKQQVQNAALGRQATALTGIPSGDKLKAGSFGISEAGRAQAEANRTEAREKKIAAMSPRNQALARQAYDKYGTITPSFSDIFSATSGDLRNPLNAPNYAAAMGAGYTDSVIGGVNFAKNLIPGVRQLPNIPTLPAYNDARLQNLRNISSFAIPGAQLTSSLSNLGKVGSLANIGKKGLSIRNAQAGFTGMDKTGFNAIRSGDKFRAGTMKLFGRTLPKPQILGGGRAYNAPSADRVRGLSLGARRYSLGTGSLGGKQEAGGVIGSIVPGGARRLRMIEAQASVPGRTFDKGVALARRLQGQSLGTDKIANPNLGAYGRSALANRLRTQLNTGVAPGTGGIGGAEVGSSLAAASAMATKATKAGGLNIGGVDSGDTNDPTARVSGFRSVRPLGIAKEALQGFGDVLTGQRTDFDQLGKLGFGATTDKLKDAAANMRINEVADTLKKSPIRQAAVGFNYGIDVPDALKQYDETKSVLGKTFKDFDGKNIDLGNIKPGSLKKNVMAEDLRGGISNVAYNLDRMPTLARGISAFQTKTDGGGDKEFRKDLRFTFNREVDAPTGVPGRDLMKATTPGIVNRVLSGKLKDMGQEAITQNNLTGGMTADKFDTIASTLNKNLKTEGTIAQTRYKELESLAKRFGPGGGQAPTPKSILGGVNPFKRMGQGGSTILSRPGGGGTTAPVGQLPQVPNPAQVELPVIPQQQEQQGTQATTLAGIQNQSYENTFNNLMAQFRPRRMGRRRNFRTSFNRDYFSQFV